MKEEWRDIQGYEGLYRVSNLGKVKSMGHRSNHVLEIELKQFTVNGYKCVVLQNRKKPKMVKVHRLVANAFIPNFNNKPQVNHIDGNKSNNCVTNLEWVTPKENIIHAFSTGLHHAQKGIENRRSIKIIQMDLSRNILGKYDGMREAERITGIDHSSIGYVCKGKAKTAGGYIWRFSDG